MTFSEERTTTARTPPDDPVVRRMSAQECWSELRRRHEGRLGYLSGRGPRHVVIPYVVHDQELVVRVPAYNEATQYVDGSSVTFDVIWRDDEHTAERIEVAGRAHVADPGSCLLDALPDEHWPADLPSRLVCLAVDDVRGRREVVGERVA